MSLLELIREFIIKRNCNGCKYEQYEDSHYCFNCIRNCSDNYEEKWECED